MELLVEQKRRVLNLILNRPEKRNALTLDMSIGIVKAVEEAQAGNDVGVILISANGPVFCAGMDLDEAVGVNLNQLAEVHDQLFTIGLRSRKPIVVAVNGAALGGGLGLVTQGHVVTASSGAAFGLTEVKVGLWPFMIFRTLEAALGSRRALELSLTGRLFNAQEALEWGLVHKISTPGELNDRSQGLAADLAKASPQAIELGLRYMHATRGKTAEEAGAVARELRCTAMNSPDFKEGYQSFKMKRQPKWPSMPESFYQGSLSLGSSALGLRETESITGK